MKIEFWKIADLIPYARNPRKNDAVVERMVSAIKEFGFRIPIIARSDGEIVDGHLRLKAAQALGMTEVPVMRADDLSHEQVKAFRLLVNRSVSWAEWDNELLKLELDELLAADFPLELTGFDLEDMKLLELEEVKAHYGDRTASGALVEKFLVPPFSVLNARDGAWQERKKTWLSLGIKSEKGRDDGLLFGGSIPASMGLSATSIFDPVLCEVAYSWFSRPGDTIIDPFAGGSVRGIVASVIGRQYVGLDLSARQVEENRAQAATICAECEHQPVWHQGDSRNISKIADGLQADFIFSCPPYADLEVYSDDPADLSTMPYPDFIKAYTEIIGKTCAMLREDRFACFVVGEVRGKSGGYYNFVSDTIAAFTAAGLEYYNEAILVTMAGTLPIRTGRLFNSARKLGKSHQNVLVFVKGSAKKATEYLGEVEIAALPEVAGDEG